MARYVVQGRYGSKRDGVQYGPWTKGTEVDLSEADAGWVDRDCPGILLAVVEEPPAVVEPVVEVAPVVAADPDLVEEAAEDAVAEPGPEEAKAPAKRPNRMRTNGPTRGEVEAPPVDF